MLILDPIHHWRKVKPSMRLIIQRHVHHIYVETSHRKRGCTLAQVYAMMDGDIFGGVLHGCYVKGVIPNSAKIDY